MLEDKTIEIAPMAYMRGRTFKNTWIVADECQNTTPNQFKMLLTRIGENSRMVITGDLDQHDRIDEINGLADFLHKFRNNKSGSISSIEFLKEHVEREDVIKDVLSIYENITVEDDTIDDDVPSLMSVSPNDTGSILNNIMEENKDDEFLTDDECESNSNGITIPSASFLNMGKYIFNKSSEYDSNI